MKAFEFFSAKRQQFAQRAQAAFAQYKEAKKQRGMTLLEVIIVLGIIGTIAAGVVVLAQRAFDSRTVSEIVQNTNTLRVAAKDVFARDGVYPKTASNATSANLLDSSTTGMTSMLARMGKIGVNEARNGISGDIIHMVGSSLTATAGDNAKGFALELVGLNESQCRAILGQTANQWDYVAVQQGAAGASVLNATGVGLASEVTDFSKGFVGNGVIKSLADNGNVNVTASMILNACNDTPNNAIILGSR
ncbi:toxin co-regulated pilin [Vibrio cholerae]|uniref:type IV pilus major pilin n=1 Tax=Vibrio cholerae TaxID=666 RepID=UPI0020892682|nr:toxin co-regulated pilin [Vibrio cholerae]